MVTATDGLGHFSAERPAVRVRGLWATVAGTRHATLAAGLPVALEEVGDETPPLGRVPAFIYLVVEGAEAAADDACACESGAPRLPDAEDLVRQSAAYSQDIGPIA